MTLEEFAIAAVYCVIVVLFLIVPVVLARELTRRLWRGAHSLLSPAYRRERQAAKAQSRATSLAIRTAWGARRAAWEEAEWERFRLAYNDYLVKCKEWEERNPPPPPADRYGNWEDVTDRYGPAHQALRTAWKGIIAEHGTDCMERVCIMPSRRIEAGAASSSWDLAHDHADFTKHSYLGPAHKVCNQAEALARGRTWIGAPSSLKALL